MKKILLIATVIGLMLVSCATQQVTDTGVRINRVVDENLYDVTLQLAEITGYGSINARFFDGSGAVWQDGKGIVRGTLLSVEPQVEFAHPESEIVVKTTDYKITALRPGDVVKLVCLADYEPVCAWSKQPDKTGECKDMWEFDYCRLSELDMSDTMKEMQP